MDATPAEEPTLPPPPATSRSSPVKTSSPAAAEATPSTSTDAAPGPGAAPATGNNSNTNSTVTATTMSTATAPAPEAPPPPHTAPGHAFAMGNAPHQMMPGAPSDASNAQKTAPPTVNAAAASSAALMTSSAMTPTTTNYGMSAQLVKSTGTLTPMGEDKVSTAGPSGTQKAKQTKKKAAAADGETAKKPSPRVRTKADPNKAEKRKASPARSNGNNASLAAAQSNGAAPTPVPPTTTTPTAVPAQSYPPMGENPAAAQQQELPPSQDTELRKQYLQRIYRQLQMTHRNQDDTMVRRLATNIEIDICRRVATRADYMNLMNQHIHSLMQAELANGTVGLQSSLYVPGVGMPPSSGAMNAPVSSASGMPQPGLQQANVGGYKQGSTPVSGAADIGQRASTPTQGSFMSLLSGQSPMQSYEAGRAPQQYGAQGVPAQGRQPQYGAASGAPGYPVQGQGLPQVPTMKSDTQSELSSQQAFAGQRVPAQPSPTSAPPDFVAQFQRLDRNGLVDLLWTQHKTVIQYQRRLAQLEVQLNARQNPATVGAANTMAPSSAGLPSGYYNASSGQPSGAVPANLSAEAEAQRARERATSRAAHQPGQYGQPQYPPQQAPTTPQGGVNLNPPLYWEKVRYLSEAYLRPLYVAHQALSQHSAPANSAQGVKAENVKHNIALACSILSEAPSTVQPRPLEVLDSIERFIQSTVVPIVRKVSPHNLGPPTPGSTQQVRPQQNPVDLNDPSRNPMGAPPVSQPAPTPTTSSGLSYSNGPQPPVAVAPAAPAAPAKGSGKAGASKAGAKAAGKKSPSSGPKKAATPKATAAKSTTKAAGKKSPGKAGGAKQAAAAAKAAAQSNSAANDPLEVPLSGQVDATPASAAPVVENTQKIRSEMPPIKTGGMTDDDLNDFSDFADLDFDDDLQDPLVKVSSNKENATGVNARKRSIEDV